MYIMNTKFQTLISHDLNKSTKTTLITSPNNKMCNFKSFGVVEL